jgi:hypothetical protein
MPLPTLNTGGIDVTNTLAKISAMRHADLQNQNIQSEMSIRAAQSPSLIAERESQNALRLVQEKEGQQKIAAEKLKDIVKAVAWIKGHPNPEEAYKVAQARYAREDIVLPTVDTFYTTQKDGSKKFDMPKFSGYADSGVSAMNLALDPKEGEAVIATTVNPKFREVADDGEPVPISADNPKLIKVRLVSQNKKLVMDPDFPVEPVIDPIEKEKRADKVAESGIEHQRKMEKHALTMEGIAARREDRAEKKALTGQFKLLTTNAVGQSIQVRSDGSTYAVDSTTGEWIPTTAEQLKGLKRTGSEESETDKLIKDIRTEREAKKVVNKKTPDSSSNDNITKARAWVAAKIISDPNNKAAYIKEFETKAGQKY